VIARLLPGGSGWRALLTLACIGAVLGAAVVIGGGVALRVALELAVPSMGNQTIVAAPRATVGAGLPFRIEGDQRPGCVLNSARWLYYRDTHAIIPLTDVNLPNVAVAYSDESTVDQTKDSQWVRAHFVLPLPRSYVPAGVARLEIQADDAPCGYYHGLLPIRALHWKSDWVIIEPENKGG